MSVLKASVDAIANLARTSNNSVGVNWTGPSLSSAINDRTQNAAAQAMSLFAIQNSSYPQLDTPPGQYEAENATVRGLLFEANQPGFSGWGFLGGWQSSGKYVKFEVNNSTAGNKVVTLKYAAAAGDAYRNISVNGIPVTNLNSVDGIPGMSFKFPGTSGWDKYVATSFTYNFPAGTSTIQIDYQSNYLNLDNITLSNNSETILISDIGDNVEVYPNPVQYQDNLNIKLYAEQPTEVNLQMFDMFGKKLLVSKKQLQKGTNIFQVPVAQLQPGTYLLQVYQGTHTETKRIVVNP